MPTSSDGSGRPAPRVYTIGHSTRQVDEVVEMLRKHGVGVLVDVRSFPASRKHPQWNQAALAEVLPADLRYHWIPALGGRRHTPAGVPTPNAGWRVKGFRDYADYMGTTAFMEGLDELEDLAANAVPAIMCSEAVPWRCHRRLISDALLVDGVEVIHLVSPAGATPAELTPFAVVHGRTITYPPTAET
ncbi:DUF488 domain-containing protein [Sinomonas cellulolyticus]|uniref:DUF488 domain-containing protein n=1 Tax=Sinomonas cellulolyticus TaxID=2801916 RepID=A0ABS1K4Y8_9MICC|nr:MULTISPECIES: DUF488 domain-containing protein [Sinomonas]MBL0706740.1 DUF488 domain-containing protein [Sinomonas cellulolyticus]